MRRWRAKIQAWLITQEKKNLKNLEKVRQQHLRALQVLEQANDYSAIFSQLKNWSELESGRAVFNDPRFYTYLDKAGKLTQQPPLHIEFIRASFMQSHLSQEELLATFFGNFS